MLISVSMLSLLRSVWYPFSSSSVVLEEGDLEAMVCLDIEDMEAITILISIISIKFYN